MNTAITFSVCCLLGLDIGFYMIKKDHYRITIDVTARPDGVNRCGDIEHHLYMVEKELLPYTVRKEKLIYKVEKI